MGRLDDSSSWERSPRALVRRLCASAPPVLSAATLIGCALTACSCGSGSSIAARPPAVWAHANVLSERDPTDRDDDRPGAGRYDPDNDQAMTWGRVASAAEAHAILALIRRYYAYAAAENLAGACSLIYAPILEALSAERHGASGRSSRCAQLLSAPFVARHAELVDDLSSQTLIEARIRQRLAIARVLFAGRRDRLIRLHGHGSSWEMYDALDGGSP